MLKTPHLWLAVDVAIALALQRPFPAGRMTVVVTGQRLDAAEQSRLTFLISSYQPASVPACPTMTP